MATEKSASSDCPEESNDKEIENASGGIASPKPGFFVSGFKKVSNDHVINMKTGPKSNRDITRKFASEFGGLDPIKQESIAKEAANLNAPGKTVKNVVGGVFATGATGIGAKIIKDNSSEE